MICSRRTNNQQLHQGCCCIYVRHLRAASQLVHFYKASAMMNMMPCNNIEQYSTTTHFSFVLGKMLLKLFYTASSFVTSNIFFIITFIEIFRTFIHWHNFLRFSHAMWVWKHQYACKVLIVHTTIISIYLYITYGQAPLCLG